MLVVISLIVFVVLNVIDALLTKSVIKLGGVEVNPIIKKFGLYPIKIVGTILLIILSVFASFLLVFLIADFILFLVCVWNYVQYDKIRHKCTIKQP